MLRATTRRQLEEIGREWRAKRKLEALLPEVVIEMERALDKLSDEVETLSARMKNLEAHAAFSSMVRR